jgi:hypothetical protein
MTLLRFVLSLKEELLKDLITIGFGAKLYRSTFGQSESTSTRVFPRLLKTLSCLIGENCLKIQKKEKYHN